MVKRAKLLILCLGAAACAAQGPDGFERHSHSRLVAVEGSASEYIFESGEAPGFTSTDPQGEAVRMLWLSEWLAMRGACSNGYEIVDKRPFGPMEYNPMRASFRYLVRCRAVSEPTAKE